MDVAKTNQQQPATKQALSVGVAVDLYREEHAGGHVKCWERLAEAAVDEPSLDLTIYFLGDTEHRETLSENVRYVHVRPRLPTHRFRFLDSMPDHTDLAPWNNAFARLLDVHHVLHTTDAFFCMAQTAQRVAQRNGRPLVTSIHTDTPGYTRVYAAGAVRRLLGNTWAGHFLADRLHVHERFGRRMERKLQRYVERCDWTLGGPADTSRKRNGNGRFSVLRRGIDKQCFHPSQRDRARLQQQFGIAPESFVLLYAGRLDPDKSVMTAAHAARRLRQQDLPVHIVFAGDGTQKTEIRETLNGAASLPGAMRQEELAWLYASADLFVFPSRNEVMPNVLVEAQACGLPLLVSAVGGSAQFVKSAQDGASIESDDAEDWAAQIAAFYRDRAALKQMSKRARRFIEAQWPSWRDVLREDLLPVWRQVHRKETRG